MWPSAPNQCWIALLPLTNSRYVNCNCSASQVQFKVRLYFPTALSTFKRNTLFARGHSQFPFLAFSYSVRSIAPYWAWNHLPQSSQWTRWSETHTNDLFIHHFAIDTTFTCLHDLTFPRLYSSTLITSTSRFHTVTAASQHLGQYWEVQIPEALRLHTSALIKNWNRRITVRTLHVLWFTAYVPDASRIGEKDLPSPFSFPLWMTQI